jgi:hypothetical protein
MAIGTMPRSVPRSLMMTTPDRSRPVARQRGPTATPSTGRRQREGDVNEIIERSRVLYCEIEIVSKLDAGMRSR